jgi:site-specific DNA recombinase
MYSDLTSKRNAVIAIRVSSDKQFQEGDSPEAQREQLTRHAENLQIKVIETFIFAESGAKVKQPMQEVIDYCRDPKNDVQFFIIKSIDRFTRGGADFYAPLKHQLEEIGVQLIDAYGVISQQRINTLDHLAISYPWSVYSPSQKTEYLEAERAKDELRDILSRMVGASIRYTRLGYWMRQNPYGFASQKIEAKHGKRVVLIPHPEEAKFVIRIYELRAACLMHDNEIVDELNRMGYRSRVHYIRSKHDRSQVISKRGGNQLDKDAMELILRNPIYAGINNEKWTNGTPVKFVFPGLVSIETFNKANRGNVVITERGDDITISTKELPEFQVNKGRRDPDFAFRRFVGCSKCGSPLYGSASKGSNGTHYPAYHCNKGHYFRVPKQELEATVLQFMQDIRLTSEQAQIVQEKILSEWQRREERKQADLAMINEQIGALELEAEQTMHKLKYLESGTAIKFMEGDIVRIENKVNELQDQKAVKIKEKGISIGKVLGRVMYFLEHLDELMKKQIDPVKKAQLFGTLFNEIPRYSDLESRTKNPRLLTGVNELFQLISVNEPGMVAPLGLEPRTQGSSSLCSTN